MTEGEKHGEIEKQFVVRSHTIVETPHRIWLSLVFRDDMTADRSSSQQ